MNAVYPWRLEMAARVRVGQGLGLAKLEELIQRAEVLAGQQRGGVAVTRSASRQRHAVRRALQSKLLGYLRVVGAVAGKVNAELAQQFRMPPSNASQQALLTAARKILERATEASRAGPKGLPRALRALGRRREHVGASADLRAVMAEVSEQVKVLDGIVRYRFGDNAELMGAWGSVHSVLGPFRSHTASTPDGGGETPGTEKAA